uniref:Uncharacterized protein n=1 Tax=Plectus sambesii TaxID=2011161 RepID=A0A914WHN5_9BILA
MRILHDNGFSPDELDNQRSLIYSNTIQGMLTMIRAMDNLGVVPKSAKMQRNASILREVVQTDQEYWPFTKETYEALKQLWADEAVQECFSRRAEYHLHDGVR